MFRLFPLIALVCAGCVRHEPAADAVQRYFKALAAGDCAVVTPLLADANASCDSLRAEFLENKVAFLGIQKVQPDGRDGTVTLVSATMRYKDRDHVWIVRAEDHDGRWKLRF